MKKQYKIAIVGPESTGKSSLSESLSNYFKTYFVPEVARDYLNNLRSNYEEYDLLVIAKKQIEVEDLISSNVGDLLICDTTLLVIKIWSQVKYNHCNSWILEEENRRKYDLFLLCDIDLEWGFDPLREHPDKRDFLFNLYYQSLLTSNATFEIISGKGNERVNNAITVINKHYPVKNS